MCSSESNSVSTHPDFKGLAELTDISGKTAWLTTLPASLLDDSRVSIKEPLQHDSSSGEGLCLEQKCRVLSRFWSELFWLVSPHKAPSCMIQGRISLSKDISNGWCLSFTYSRRKEVFHLGGGALRWSLHSAVFVTLSQGYSVRQRIMGPSEMVGSSRNCHCRNSLLIKCICMYLPLWLCCVSHLFHIDPCMLGVRGTIPILLNDLNWICDV